MIDMKKKIPGASNFTYWELIKSDTAIRMGVDNAPDDIALRSLERLAVNVLQPIRDHFGTVKINSGYRSLMVNEKIGSSKSSNHCKGEAVDIECPAVSLLDLGIWIAKTLAFRELIFEYLPDGWIHVAYREGKNIGVIKLKDRSHNYTVLPLNEIIKLYS